MTHVKIFCKPIQLSSATINLLVHNWNDDGRHRYGNEDVHYL
jgi:hypothetical protein